MSQRCTVPVLFMLFCAAGLAHAQDSIDQSRRNAIVRAVEKVAPAVVTVNVIDIQYEAVVDPFFQNFSRFFDFPRPRARYRERAVRAIGTGFVFDPHGYIITNGHVVENAESISVTLPDGRTLEVQLVGVDKRGDIAVLKANEESLPHIELGQSSNLLIGEWMIAFGNPFGMLVKDPKPTVSVGVVSANHRRVSPNIGDGERLYQDMIQTDAAINPGNSGGPLVNSSGQVVGVNTFIFSQSGGNVGLGFAIPIDRAKRVANELILFGARRDPWPGFTVIFTREGTTVNQILENSPAHRAGIIPGDIMLSLNEQPITHPSEVDFGFWELFVGDTANVTILRGGREYPLSFQIEEIQR